MSVSKDRVRLLVDALRSGEFKQGAGCLRSRGEAGIEYYCCLGVATEVALRNGLVVDDKDLIEGGHPWNQSYQVMSPPVADWFGFSSGDPVLEGPEAIGGHKASHWNDDYNVGFDAIADAFERTYITSETDAA